VTAKTYSLLWALSNLRRKYRGVLYRW